MVLRSAAVRPEVRFLPSRWRGSARMAAVRVLSWAFALTGRRPQCRQQVSAATWARIRASTAGQHADQGDPEHREDESDRREPRERDGAAGVVGELHAERLGQRGAREHGGGRGDAHGHTVAPDGTARRGAGIAGKLCRDFGRTRRGHLGLHSEPRAAGCGAVHLVVEWPAMKSTGWQRDMPRAGGQPGPLTSLRRQSWSVA